MTVENTGVALARQAVDALRDLDQYGERLRPDGADRFLWSADVLDELARVAQLVGAAVENSSGEGDRDVQRLAADLSRAITGHRNTLLRHGRGRAPFDRTEVPADAPVGALRP